ncbi:MAG: hypothetical protein WCG25_04300 [bacterium]
MYHRVLRQANTSLSVSSQFQESFFLVSKIFKAHSSSLTFVLIYFAMRDSCSKSIYSCFISSFA